MFDHLQSRIHDAASRAGRTAAIGLGASVALCVGLGFLTLSAWLFLLTVTEPAMAALIIGGVYTGTALIAFATLSSSDRNTRKPSAKLQEKTAEAEEEAPLPPLAQAFVSGLRAGARARS